VIVGGEVTVMFLNGSDFVAEPDSNLVDAFTNGDQHFNRKIADIGPDRDTIEGDNRINRAKKVLLRRWFWVRVPADPASVAALYKRRINSSEVTDR
jgi:hypothetical protein